ncbi:MAG: hypothetical protein U0836_11385 [Pirellulales bacterium]
MAQISVQLNVAVGTIHNDLKRVREAWRESSVRDFDELRYETRRPARGS